MLTIRNINYKFEDKIIFNDANLIIDNGELIWIQGPNGSGKTTLFKFLSGLTDNKMYDEELDMCLDGNKITIEDLRKNVTFIPNDPYLFEYLSGKENVDYLMSLFNLSNVKDKIYRNLETLNLKDDLSNPVIDYSLGMRIKLFLGTMIERDSSIFIIDELLGNLDKVSLEFILNIIREKIKIENKTIIFSSHINILRDTDKHRVVIIKEKGIDSI